MKKTALIILDGFGISSEEKGNAIIRSGIPYIRSLIEQYPKTLLKTSSQEVGLPWGEAGNSEVGHTTIGLGRVILQDLPQIDKLFRNGRIAEKNTINEALELAKKCGKVHLIGLASDGAVHGHIEHLVELSKFFIKHSIRPVLHLIADGRDVPEKSLGVYLEKIDKDLGGDVIIGSLSGRYFAMDRDKNFDRTQKAYDAMHGKDVYGKGVDAYVKEQYEKDITDEFIEPISFDGENGIRPNEPAIFTNFRSDRALQLTRSFVDKSFSDFDRGNIHEFFATMTTYDDNLQTKVIFSNLDLNDPSTNPLSSSLPEILSQNNIKQFHVGETEKFAHVTYYFAGGVKKEFKGQKNVIIPSKKVKSYDQFPQMMAKEISEEIIKATDQGYEFIVANYANGDMVGHSGSLEKTIESITYLDNCLRDSIEHLIKSGFGVYLTADHGNADEMIDLKSDKPSKEHSINPVPLIHISNEKKGQYKKFDEFITSDPIGILSDIAPTILSDIGIPIPSEMSGADLRESLS